MATSEELLTPPSINKTASIATQGRAWGEIGATGQKPYTLDIPTLQGRSLNPQLRLAYDSNAGNGPCGLGWNLDHPSISRKTSKGVPRYLNTDVMLADGSELRPALNADGQVLTRPHSHGTVHYSVTLYIPRLESGFNRYEFWTPDNGRPGFWIVYHPDGSQYCYGNNSASCIHDPDQPQRIAVWLLVEIMNALGEHLVFKYQADDVEPDPRFDYRAQRYLSQIVYCNKTASDELYCLTHEDPAQTVEWLLTVVADYGARSVDPDIAPTFAADEDAWPLRQDPSRMHRYGFEVGTRRLCRQFLMFNRIGPAPVLTHRLLLEYENTPLHYSQLTAAHVMGYDAKGQVEKTPPMEFSYAPFLPDTTPRPFLALDHMPGLNDGETYHCIDLYGEGLPGILCQYDGTWYYREPLRGEAGTEEVVYGPWTLLPLIPNADSSKPAIQILTDISGDGCLNWVFVLPGMAGYYTLKPDRSWSDFQPFERFPAEVAQAFTQWADLSGGGLQDFAVIGPKSVRVYANQREDGFAAGIDVPHEPDDRLPLPDRNVPSELTMLGHLNASDHVALCRIRHDEIKCWANLGHGTFAEGHPVSPLPFDYATFNADQVRVADLDGSGAPALIYLRADGFEIYFNHGGNELDQQPLRVPWPSGVRYDPLCQVTFADLQGLGCASLLLTVPHMTPRHWVYHFVSERPYLLSGANNNMGYDATLGHASSAQYWLDEKRQLLEAGERPVCHLPFPQQVLKYLRQDDEVTGNYLMQRFQYFEGCFDPRERELRGFGRVYQTDSELTPGLAESGHTAPMRVKQWFHVGRTIDQPLKDTCESDQEYRPLGATKVAPGAEDHPDMPYALSGRLLRSETSQADDPVPARLFTLDEVRYQVEVLDEAPSRLIVQELETRRFQYERIMNDPRCQHVVILERNPYGQTVHSLTVDCARRRNENDDPPFEEDSQKRAWRDSFDQSQNVFYLSEWRAEFHQLIEPPHWLLNLPWCRRSNALTLPPGVLPVGLSAEQISAEHFLRHQDSNAWNALRELTSLSVQHYQQSPEGELSFPPLAIARDDAVFDKQALAAYDAVPDFDIRLELDRIGYVPMPFSLPVDPEADKRRELWAVESEFFTYAAAADFYQVTKVQPTASHGETEISSDTDHLRTTVIKQPDGCQTHITWDYHHLQPKSVSDANLNIQEALFLPDGRTQATSFYGTEDGKRAGFRPLSEYPIPADPSPESALGNPPEYLAAAAIALAYDLLSWMPKIPLNTALAEHLQWIAKGLVQPDGRVRASVLRRLKHLKNPDVGEQALLDLLSNLPRVPVHSAALRADRYFNDPQRQIQISITHVDGSGRTLQTKQLVEKGLAYVRSPDGSLELENGVPRQALADPRWRVSGRAELNHKGEPIRVFQPYFINSEQRVNDSSMRESGYFDELFYDATGRQIQVINAKGHLAFELIHPWFTAKYDYNDTDESPPTKPLKRSGR
ncbi:SpvB/TcaC N-terminal domain-containing protein [Pseudomonas botevensis]|uniref:SpvB/TcaC N-terminal domain-containing protein n=1 Tax=Pseudomonas botevensis TaxID=2842352 RepID=UPI001C3C9CD6|nr:SpvB/TcaC N-terminal domain-containing protein [Pseudomonas botevensis]MBV4476365.1 toxin [Pseudomonas botevensis]